VEKTMGFRESFLATEISRHLGNYLEEHDRGLPFGADAPFRLRPGKVRIPDTGFVSWDRLPNHEFPEDPILDAVPNLAVEVYSEGNTPAEMEVKLIDYFQAGVLVVWIVYPKTRSAEVYTSPTKKQVIPPDGVLDGGRLLPGFTLPLKTLFKRLSKRRNGKKGNGRK
jgi:Uma2 family endonuclease